MRLIDADALLEESEWVGERATYDNPMPEGEEMVSVESILNAPTVLEVGVEGTGVIIKGMVMPEDCRVCPMCGYECDIGRTRCIIGCRILAEHYKAIPFDGRPEWCPLEESEDLE